MSESMSGGDSAEPNLVPILDMVFQLITFFMLVMNFKAATMDLGLKLPVVGSAAPVPTAPSDGAVVLNVDAQGTLKVAGTEVVDLERFAASEGLIAQLASKRASADYKPGDDLVTTVVIRADKETRFCKLYRVISSFQQQGFRRFQYMASRNHNGIAVDGIPQAPPTGPR